MGIIQHSPKIVTDGLVLYLDAANPKSYASGSSTWRDLSGNRVNFTQVGTVLLDDGGFGCTTSNYWDAYAGWTTYIPTGSADRTIIAFVRVPATIASTTYNHIIHYGTAIANQTDGLAIWKYSGAFFLGSHIWTNVISAKPSTKFDKSVADYYSIGYTYNGTNASASFFMSDGETTEYQSGSYYTNAGASISPVTLNTGTTTFRIGCRISTPSENFSGGRIYAVMVYNRILSVAELEQNFRTLQKRFKI